MSDRDFENYLSLLAGLLRLQGQQRAAIADELRAHLEDRMEELLAQGVSRDEAVQQALAEFGDAAGLAGQFLAISQNRKRRWLMRITTFSLAATLLIAAALTTFWPGRNAAPGVANLDAQEADTREKKVAADHRSQVLHNASTARIEKELNEVISIDTVEQPLHALMSSLAEKHNIPIVISLKKLDEASVPLDTPVTKSLHGITLRSALRLILKDLELTYVVRDEVLQITTPEDAESQLLIHVYDCRDLLTMTAPGIEMGAAAPSRTPPIASTLSPTPATKTEPTRAIPGVMGAANRPPKSAPTTEFERRSDQLVELVTSIVVPDSWNDVGGPGSIDVFNGLVVVSQTMECHEQIERLFDMLREAAGLEVPKTGKVVR